MADLEFNTASGQTVDRELLIAYNLCSCVVAAW